MSTSALKVGDPLWVGKHSGTNRPRWNSTWASDWDGTWLKCDVHQIDSRYITVVLPDGGTWQLLRNEFDNGWSGGWTTRDPTAPSHEEESRLFFYEIDLHGEWMVVPDFILKQAIAAGESHVRRTQRSWPYEQELGYTIDPRDNTTFVKFFWKSKEVQK